MNEDQIEQFLPYIYDKLSWLDREQLIKHFVSTEFNRYLSYYRHARDINIESPVSEKVRRKKPKRRRKNFLDQKIIEKIEEENLLDLWCC